MSSTEAEERTKNHFYCFDCGKNYTQVELGLHWDGRHICDDCSVLSEIWEVCRGCVIKTKAEIYEQTRLLGLVF